MILTQDHRTTIDSHVRREGRDAVISYHTAHLNGAASHYADPPAVEETKRKLRDYHGAALEYVMTLPLPVAKRRGGGA